MNVCYILSVCGICLSLWGVFQLGVMGWAYSIGTVMLVEDVEPLPGEYTTFDDYIIQCEEHYKLVANNCFISAYIYIGVIVVSVISMLLARFVGLLKRRKQLEDDDYYCAAALKEDFRKMKGMKKEKEKKLKETESKLHIN